MSAITVTASVVLRRRLLKSASSEPPEPQQARPFLAAFSTAARGPADLGARRQRLRHVAVASPDGSRIIVGGHFLTLNGTAAPGLGSVGATSGATLPFAATARIVSGGPKGGVTSLRTDGTQVYGTGYAFGSGNFEGTFARRPEHGHHQLRSTTATATPTTTFPSGQVLYAVSHVHACEWHRRRSRTPTPGPCTTAPPSAPTRTGDEHRSRRLRLELRRHAVLVDPALVPDDHHRARTPARARRPGRVTGNSSYVAMGGEFPYVNGVAQQGLVRFAVPAVAPNKLRSATSSARAPARSSISPGSRRAVAGQRRGTTTTPTLTYKSSGTARRPRSTRRRTSSNFWTCRRWASPTPGSPRVHPHLQAPDVTDPFSNKSTRPRRGRDGLRRHSSSAYAQRRAQRRRLVYWRLGEPRAARRRLRRLDRPGPRHRRRPRRDRRHHRRRRRRRDLRRHDDRVRQPARRWCSGPSQLHGRGVGQDDDHVRGGKIVGFGNAQTGTSSSYDRHLYMDNAGRVDFGVYNGGAQRDREHRDATTTAAGTTWSATLSPGRAWRSTSTAGRSATRRDAPAAQPYSGYWRVGGDNLGGWPNKPTSNYLAGTIDDVAIYPTALTRPRCSATTSTAVAPRPDPGGAGRRLRRGGLPRPPRTSTGGSARPAAPRPPTRGRTATPATTTAASPWAGRRGVGATDTAATFDGSTARSASSSVQQPDQLHRGGVVQDHHRPAAARSSASATQQPATRASYDRHVYMQRRRPARLRRLDRPRRTRHDAAELQRRQWHHVVGHPGLDGHEALRRRPAGRHQPADRGAELHRLLAGRRRQLLGRPATTSTARSTRSRSGRTPH